MVRVRSFDWRDVPSLYTYRSQALFLDSALLLTRGRLQLLGAMLSAVAPNSGLFTAVAEHESQPHPRLIGQVLIRNNCPAAHLSFLSPDSLVRDEFFSPLLTFLTYQVVGYDALCLLAEAEPGSQIAQALHDRGFSSYGTQRVWRLPSQLPSHNSEGQNWRMVRPEDRDAIQRLYRRIAPPLLQKVSGALLMNNRGLVLRDGDQALGYVSLRYGLMGVVVQPILRPELSAITVENMFAALNTLPFLRTRPLYMIVTANQEWLESFLLDVGAQAAETQTLLVKNLTAPPLRVSERYKAIKTPGLFAL